MRKLVETMRHYNQGNRDFGHKSENIKTKLYVATFWPDNSMSKTVLQCIWKKDKEEAVRNGYIISHENKWKKNHLRKLSYLYM